MYNDLCRCLAILEGNGVPRNVYFQYPNVSECSLLDRYLIQVSEDFVTEGSVVNNLIAETRGGIYVLKQRNFESITI